MVQDVVEPQDAKEERSECAQREADDVQGAREGQSLRRMAFPAPAHAFLDELLGEGSCVFRPGTQTFVDVVKAAIAAEAPHKRFFCCARCLTKKVGIPNRGAGLTGYATLNDDCVNLANHALLVGVIERMDQRISDLLEHVERLDREIEQHKESIAYFEGLENARQLDKNPEKYKH